ncbi:MAG: MFS transporter [Psychrilyobacter sp.]|uniref:MFS transporter n=1 Tax=Psychrilyobacter sp. TaxID=2586924 RepID=UPI003C787632
MPFFNSSNTAIFSQVAPKNSIEKANSLFTTGKFFVAVIAPVLGIIIYTKYGFNTLIFLNMLSFIISGILEMFLKVRKREEKSDSGKKEKSI